ncbi:MAG: integrase arm-type DNA-binding domain-containing protein [Burkholderiales bacterium]
MESQRAPKVELSALAVSRLKRPGLHFVGGVKGLAMQITPNGARSWVLRIAVGGKRREMGLGGFPSVGLAAAREEARARRKLVADGIDPVAVARANAARLTADRKTALAFDDACTQFIESQSAEWKSVKHGAQWAATLKTYASPFMGKLLVRDIHKEHVLAALKPIWTTKTETATRVRGRIEQVIAWSDKQTDLERLNPARWKGHLELLLPKPSKVQVVEHHKALPIGAAGAFMTELRKHEGNGAKALEFTILCASRSGEVRGASWSEIDLDAGVWTIPGLRMKMGKLHKVPLSAPAVKLLRAQLAAQKFEPPTELVFPSANGKPLSDMAMTAVVRRMGADCVPHGFRSTFRDWCAERTSYPSEMCEIALAHAVGDKVMQAYLRSDMLEKRRRLMSDWAAFLAKPEVKTATVTPIGKARKAKAA